MRVRNKPWAKGYMADHLDRLVVEPEPLKGNWQSRFPSNQPLFVEIGTGKGQFIIEMARQHPDHNFIGIEIQTSVIAVALKGVVNSGLTNIQLVHTDGEAINTFFEAGEVAGLYLNFSDPWPKKRHTKRRLTSPVFLAHYADVLQPEGQLQFKTDNRGLFEYSLGSLNNFGMVFEGVWLDLHAATDGVEDIQTEYEQKFSKKGPIYQVIAHFSTKN
ncbi:tRNA (guanosine(46)-N7)-methyltransferase TrmB [Levilactobacillus brevis]|uniref:tRNA (guanine-N(7)-)-methyltransferase n=1 Tax=Levilactobacillus brevis TaxID=1580 RepID=A0AA41EQH3_LEVBR|nr:tRNA (guanosine(46)-N7)-methyltransferase TrmB [Levilactobacillus brevis]MBS0947935.1 tRNA (guanosine(46)-N7)-methyltransferase TrmB [Levilactobacillus brevis]MBS0978934.1 tRNA (guanosine(46)-N7)-methyltransferase TrmB [Levilactobacillus brevis]MBS1011023.1 tRNA (guanosine(46)-N7)-methyltransferase TrmB [Levilactobacillus brevis]